MIERVGDFVDVSTFENQDESRTAVAYMCSRFASDVVALIDSATAPGSAEEHGVEAPALTEEYAAFRAWIGPEIASLAQACVVGPVLSGMSVDRSGRVRITPARYTDRRQVQGMDRLLGRLVWLVNEIPSLIDAYGELYEDEVIAAMGDVKRADDLDLAEEEDRRVARELLPELETWYSFAHPGARYVRGDDKAREAGKVLIKEAREYIKDIEAKKEAELEMVRGKEVPEESREDVIARIELRLTEINSELSRLDRKSARLDEEREALNDRMISLGA